MGILKKIGKIVGIILGGIVGVVVLVWAVTNVAKFAIYAEYYSIEEEVAPNPGLGDGFVQQGIANVDDEMFIVSGYMANDGEHSRLYVVNTEEVVKHVKMVSKGKTYTGHAGGVAYSRGNLYLANGSKIYTFSLQSVLDCEDGGTVEIGSGVKVNNNASFVSADENYLYVGEFNLGQNYVCNHPYQTAEGLHKAIVTQYSLDDLTKPVLIYSIRDKVQGMAFVDGYAVLSTSFSVADSIYYIYELDRATDSGKTLDGAKVLYLEHCIKEIHGPAMSEDLAPYGDGKVVTLTESACDKYVFGKFFFANKITVLDFQKALE